MGCFRGGSQPARAGEYHNGTLPVVGESNYQTALARQYRKHGGTEHDVKVTAQLQPEQGNPHDANAVRVAVGGGLVGYLPRQAAAEYRAALGAAAGLCSAKIVGGYLMEDGERASFGVKLNAAWPPRFKETD
ncbi:MAG: HIRAN domain-containing protein [Pseudomonadota bacterium]